MCWFSVSYRCYRICVLETILHWLFNQKNPTKFLSNSCSWKAVTASIDNRDQTANFQELYLESQYHDVSCLGKSFYLLEDCPVSLQLIPGSLSLHPVSPSKAPSWASPSSNSSDRQAYTSESSWTTNSEDTNSPSIAPSYTDLQSINTEDLTSGGTSAADSAGKRKAFKLPSQCSCCNTNSLLRCKL